VEDAAVIDCGPRANQVEQVQGKLAAAIMNAEVSLASALDPLVQERLRRALEAVWAASASLRGDPAAQPPEIPREGDQGSGFAAQFQARWISARSKLAAAIIQLELACVMQCPRTGGCPLARAALEAAWAGAELLADLPIENGVRL
jgi:hypothetical protein